MTAATVVDQICQYFGGPYVAQWRNYRTPTVAGISLVRRAWPKEDDFADYFLGQAAGTATGCQMVVWLLDDDDHRVALPAITGRREVHYTVELHCFIWSTAQYAEDVADFVYGLGDAITARIRSDITLGTGGIENNAIQVGEGGTRIARHREQGATTDEGTKAYLLIQFEAHAYDVA